ncbi:MAG: hypothetical protein DRI57_14075 [Deltaproteobacteria bacterium]|nr:MAG: hypothetical protein DRI57_14075 [Deltaproteobacteria bacterium]
MLRTGLQIPSGFQFVVPPHRLKAELQTVGNSIHIRLIIFEIKEDTMYKNKKIVFLTVLFYLLPFHAFASLDMKIHRLDADNFPALKAYLSIEQDGTVLDNTNPSDFKAMMAEGKDVHVNGVSSLKDADENVAMVLAVDTSGSMKNKQLEAIKKAIRKLISEKKVGDMAALISFNDDVFVNCDFTKDTDEFLSKLDKLKRGGSITVLFKAVYKGLEMLEREDLPRLRNLIVLSDGKDEGVGFELNDSIEKSKKSRIPVYTLGFVSKKKADAMYLDNMERLANKTEGEYRKVDSIQDIIIAYSVIGDKILRQQLLKLEAGFDGDGYKHSLEIQYNGTSGETAVGKAEFYAPLILKPEPPQADSGTDPKQKQELEDNSGWGISDELISGLSNKLLYSIALILIIALLLIFLLRKEKYTLRPTPQPTDRSPEELPERRQEAFPQDEDHFASPPPADQETASAPQFPAMKNPLILNISALGKAHPLASGTMTLGAYPDNNLVLDADVISGHHAEISGNGEEWMLKDLGSTNGTWVNGERISGSTMIHEGDIIRIGPFDIEVST